MKNVPLYRVHDKDFDYRFIPFSDGDCARLYSANIKYEKLSDGAWHIGNGYTFPSKEQIHAITCREYAECSDIESWHAINFGTIDRRILMSAELFPKMNPIYGYKR